MRIYALCAIILFLSLTISAQKIPLFHQLDSVKAQQKTSLSSLIERHADKKIIDSIRDQYNDTRDSLKEQAHDCADSIIDHMDTHSHIELGLDIASSQYYYGRKGPASGAVGSPSLKYFNKTGLYSMVNSDIYDIKYATVKKLKAGKIDTVSGQKTEPDIVFTAGFARTFFDRWDVEVYYDHTFIFYGTDRNLLANSIDINTGFDFWDYITAKVEYAFLFGGASIDPVKRKQSNILAFDLYKDFRIYRLPGAAVLSISPEILSNLGNDNLARSRVIARNRHGGIDAAQLYDNFFGLLDVEAAVNIEYRIKNLELSFSPHMVIPFNTIPTTLPPTVTNVSQLSQYRQNQMQSPIFYASVGIKYIFKFWKEQENREHHRTKKAAK